MTQRDLLQRFEQFYVDLKAADLDQLRDLYAAAAAFRDPVHELVGVERLREYFVKSQQAVSECRFEFHERVENESRCFYRWSMHYRHPRLQNGRPLVLHGMTYLQIADGRIHYHEDSYDLGAMLYEHVPLLRTGVLWLKKRLVEG